MEDGYPRRVPDPSVTIPDYGAHRGIQVKEQEAEVARTPEGDVALDGRATAPAPRRSGLRLVVLALVGMLVAVVAGALGFFVVVFGGAVMWLLLG